MTCQQKNLEKTHPVGLLQPLSILKKKWESISMDFITGLPKVHGRYCIYVVVDRMTKFTHLFSIPSEYKETWVAYSFFRGIFTLHGLLKYIVSEKDKKLLIGFQEMLNLAGKKLTPNTIYYPHIDD
jgi:hypothetical protein